MSKAVTGSSSHSAPAQHNSKQRTTPAEPKPHSPARSTSTSTELIVRIWDTLQWRKTLQVAFIIAVAGITAALLLAGLEIAARTITSQAAAWPVSITVTATLSYRAARRQRR
jgi:hypothetical protein